MPLVIATAPTVEPVSLEDAKMHLKVDEAYENTLLNALIITAREMCEQILNRALITQTWDMYLDAFPEIIEVPKPPLASVTYIKYYDTDGNLQTWTASEYSVDTYSKPGKIQPAYSESYPSVRAIPNTINVRFVAGYGAAATDVPYPIKAAILLMIADLFEDRGVTSYKKYLSDETIMRLLYPFRIWSFG